MKYFLKKLVGHEIFRSMISWSTIFFWKKLKDKNYFKKIHHQLFNNQSTELSSSSEIDNIIQEGEVIFKKNPTVGLPEVSKLIDSAISKRQGDRIKYCIEGKMDSLWAPRISHHLMDWAMKQSTHQFHKIFFHISKCLACNAEKTLQLKITKKEWI